MTKLVRSCAQRYVFYEGQKAQLRPLIHLVENIMQKIWIQYHKRSSPIRFGPISSTGWIFLPSFNFELELSPLSSCTLFWLIRKISVIVIVILKRGLDIHRTTHKRIHFLPVYYEFLFSSLRDAFEFNRLTICCEVGNTR